MREPQPSLSVCDYTTHDYRRHNRGWGHDLAYTPIKRNRLRATGWGRGIKPGDFILLSNGDADTRYQFTTIDYYADPSDMWRAVLSFAPRES